ncbi:hypothetical protein VFPFJ_00561 [Purpureocillium lilacinum]|uniref:Uncharacterized protein n=1 Tax=Purpureocillium lilacinum TaxID=33203 RepID=A0A179HAN2_PURLI|nr:hypothetical protein VFPFJ_00561 [Purpureocillium lilacinum]OAQ86489.1 hypothetical protein VFPBJ_00529 [Purpureocillium lilacinum]OAQ94452.1 hypothetical protein VFPFJ_00561 [Purpureocillium lilacinum]
MRRRKPLGRSSAESAPTSLPGVIGNLPRRPPGPPSSQTLPSPPCPCRSQAPNWQAGRRAVTRRSHCTSPRVAALH